MYYNVYLKKEFGWQIAKPIKITIMHAHITFITPTKENQSIQSEV